MDPTTVMPKSKKIFLAQKNSISLIQDLFIYSSLVCNKSCHHCFVSSTPTNKTLDEMTMSDLDPIWTELQDINTDNIYFTGGEPFLNNDIIAMITEAVRHAPVTIYTNATRPLEKKLNDLKKINQEHIKIHGKALLLRISLDHIDADIHDIYFGRGEGAWKKSIQVAIDASEVGLNIAITTQTDIHNQAPDSWVEKSFIKLFQDKGITLQDVKVLPDIPTGKHEKPSSFQKLAMSESEFRMSGSQESGLMCHTGRTLIKLRGRIQVMPCTLIIPDREDAIAFLEEYNMGPNLNSTLNKGQLLNHPACRAYCVVGKQSCAN